MPAPPSDVRAPEPVDALFFSLFEDVDRWHNDYAPSASGPTGKRAPLLSLEETEGDSILARTARQSTLVDGGVVDFARFMSTACYDSTIEYRRYDAFSISHLSGKYYESFGRRHGFDVRHVNQATRVDVERLGRRFAPRYVMLSTTFNTEVANVLDAAQHLRRAWPETPIVIGGLFLVEVQKAVPPASFQRLLASFGADVAVITPMGEAAFLGLLRHEGADLTGLDLPGAWIRSGRRFVECPSPDPGVPIDEHWVRWDDLDPAGLYHTVHTRTARSCAFICSFCSYPANQGPLTLSRPETLELELERLRRVGTVRSIVFTDDTFNVPMPRFRELCRVLSKFDFRWYSFFRSQFADEDTVRLMVDSGCGGAFLGYESLDDRVLKNMRKAATRKAYSRGTRMLKKHGIPCHANFIIGFPGDVPENSRLLLDFVDDHGIEFFNATPWFCSPATPIHREKERFGIEGDFYRWKHDTMDSETAMALEEEVRTARTQSVWMTELGGRNFWTELFLYENGCTVPEAQRMVRTFNRFAGRDTPRAALEADPEFRWLRGRLAARPFPEPPGIEHFRPPAEAARPVAVPTTTR